MGKRTAYCGELRRKHIGQEVTLFGWVQRVRDMGNLAFVDLRDREGLIQVVVSSENRELLEAAKKLRMEYVAAIKGVVQARAENMQNPQLPSGEVEVAALELEVLGDSRVPPFVIADPAQAAEDLRFQYRYLDLRRPALQRNLRLRHQAALRIRNFLSEQGFYEIETPFLTKSTPEGARDYLVPSRIYKGRFFALPQSPQLFKQILMIAGFDRYFQIVRCFRDEDLRADRQPEFTQVDLEMSFAGREDIFNLVESLMAATFSLIGVEVETPFPRLTYEDSLAAYGTDKPDLRFELKIKDLTEAGASFDSEVIGKALSAGGVLKGLVVEGEAGLSRGKLDRLDQMAKDLGGKGLIWIKKQEGFKSSLKLTDRALESVCQHIAAQPGDLVLLVADEKQAAFKVLGKVRESFIFEKCGQPTAFRFAWVTDFPLFQWSEGEGRLVSVHHPFTSPREEDLAFLEKKPLRVRAKAYDLVLNGFEIGGGSVRIHDLSLQRRIFKILGLSEREAEAKFGFFLEALGYGAPPHAGIALGFDRMVMLLAGEKTIRDVIPFPKTTSSLCLLTGSPSPVDPGQLKDLGIKIE